MIKVSCISLKRFHGKDEAQKRLRLITPSYDRDQSWRFTSDYDHVTRLREFTACRSNFKRISSMFEASYH